MSDLPRRSVLAAAGTTIGTALLTSTGRSVAARTDDASGDDGETHPWPMYRGGPARTASS